MNKEQYDNVIGAMRENHTWFRQIENVFNVLSYIDDCKHYGKYYLYDEDEVIQYLTKNDQFYLSVERKDIDDISGIVDTLLEDGIIMLKD